MNVINGKFKKGDVILIPGDIHFPNHDDAALQLALMVGSEAGAKTLLTIGDTIDCRYFSRHSSARSAAQRSGDNPKDDNEWVRGLSLSAMVFGMSRLIFLTGNHEGWVNTSLGEDNPVLWGSLLDQYPTLHFWEVYDGSDALSVGKLLVTHGHGLKGSCSKTPARSVLNNYPGNNFLFGHVHRVDSAVGNTWVSGLRTQHGAWTVGCIKDLAEEEPALKVGAQSHQHGFAIVTVLDDEGNFSVELVSIFDKEDRKWCVFRGQIHENAKYSSGLWSNLPVQRPGSTGDNEGAGGAKPTVRNKRNTGNKRRKNEKGPGKNRGAAAKRAKSKR